MPSPYADVASTYLDAGWSPIRLPFESKEPPPTGYTGYLGRYADADDVARWSRGRANVGLRLPETVIGIDVDHYGDKSGGATLRAAEDRLGPLPPTWRSTSRDADLTSGIRFYRVPAGRQWADEVGPAVELIHHGHRYAVVAPSLHPEGRSYLWFDPDGFPADDLPAVDDLPLLPDAWVAELDRGAVGERIAKVDLDKGDAGQWLQALPDGEPCRVIAGALADAEREFAGNAARHGIGLRYSQKIVRYGEQGHVGAAVALDTLEAMWRTALSHRSPGEGEWERMVTGAVAMVLADPTDEAAKGCCSSPVDDFGDLFDATPTLSAIRQAARAQAVGPEALLCVVLARVLAEAPPSVVLPPVIGGPASLNLGVALVGKSGGGKSALLSVSRRVLGLTGEDQKQIERNIGSGEGMAETFLYDETVVGPRGGVVKTGRKLLIRDPRRVLIADEVGQLDAISNRSGATFGPTLRSALTGGALGQENASSDRKRNVPEGAYRLVVVMGVQPTRSGALLKDSDAGTPQRLVWVTVGDPDAPDEDMPWPESLGEWFLPPTLPDLIAYPDGIKDEVRAARRKRLRDDEVGDREGHMLLLRLKVATALALLHWDLSIDDRWWRLAGQIVERSMSVQDECRRVLAEDAAESRRNAGRLDGIRAEGAAQYRSERVVKAAAAIWRKVAKHAHGAKDGNDQKHEPADGCTDRCVSRALRDFVDRAEVRVAALDHAAESDWIAAQDGRWVPGESRPA